MNISTQSVFDRRVRICMVCTCVHVCWVEGGAALQQADQMDVWLSRRDYYSYLTDSPFAFCVPYGRL